MRKFEYVQFKEIIEQRSFRKNLGLSLSVVGCCLMAFAFIGLTIPHLIAGEITSAYTIPAIFVLVISQIFSALKSSPEAMLEKLKKDFEDGKDIDLSEYENKIKEK